MRLGRSSPSLPPNGRAATACRIYIRRETPPKDHESRSRRRDGLGRPLALFHTYRHGLPESALSALTSRTEREGPVAAAQSPAGCAFMCGLCDELLIPARRLGNAAHGTPAHRDRVVVVVPRAHGTESPARSRPSAPTPGGDVAEDVRRSSARHRYRPHAGAWTRSPPDVGHQL